MLKVGQVYWDGKDSTENQITSINGRDIDIMYGKAHGSKSEGAVYIEMAKKWLESGQWKLINNNDTVNDLLKVLDA